VPLVEGLRVSGVAGGEVWRVARQPHERPDIASQHLFARR
jgi:hypothetical protein